MQKKGKKFKKNKKFRTPAVIFKEYREMHVLAVNLGKICLSAFGGPVFGCFWGDYLSPRGHFY